MALEDHLVVLDRIAQDATNVRRKLKRYIDQRVEIQDGSGDSVDLTVGQRDALVALLRPLVVRIKADAASLPNL